MKKKKVKKQQRPSKLDLVTAESFQQHLHDSTSDISRVRAVLDFEHEAIENQIGSLTRELADARGRRAHVEAQVAGLNAVIAKR